MTRILICEGETTLAQEIARCVETCGYSIAGVASTGEQAVQHAEESKPELILMDMKLEGAIDGIGAVERIRARMDVPVVYLISHGGGDFIERAKMTEPYGYLAKPVGMIELRSTVETALHKHDTDKRMRASEVLHRLLLEQVGNGIGYWDLDGMLLFVNRVGAAQFNGVPADLVGKSLFDLFEKNEAQEYLLRIRRVAESKSAAEYEDLVSLPAGDRWLVSNYTPVMDASGVLTGVQIVSLDITEHRNAEEALRESEEKLGFIAETIEDVFWMSSPVTDEILYVSPAYETLWGWSRESLYKSRQSFMNTVHPEDRERLRNIRNEYAQDHWEAEYRIIRSDGMVRWIHDRGFPVREENGEVRLMTGVARDITDRMTAEETLRENELWMRSVFDALEESVVLVTPQRVVRDINSATERIFGFCKDEVTGRATEMFHIDHAHYEEFGRRILEAFKKGESAEFEFELKRKDGETFPSHHTVALLNDGEGKSIGIASIVRDITERRKAEEALHQSRKSFASIVEKSADAVLVIGVERKVLYANPSAITLLGYDEQYLKTIPFGTPVVSGEVASIQIARPDGEIRDVEMRIAPTDWFGQSAHVVMLRDMTERQRHERALRKEKENAERYLNLAGVMFVILDNEGKVVRVNRKACEVLDRESDEMEGRDWFATVFEENVQKDMRAVFDTFLLGTLGPHEFVEGPVVTKAGDHRTILWHNVIIKDERGAVVGTISSGEDVTERKKMETLLAASEERYRILFERSSDAILIVAPEGDLVTANPATAALLGVGEDELKSLNIKDFYLDVSDRTSLQKEIEAKGFVKDYPLEIRGREGTEKLCLCSSSLWRDQDGAVIAYLSMIRDMTESRRLEEQLRQSQKMESIGTLAGGIAHDFNNILTIVQGYSEMLLAEKSNEHADYADLSAINSAAQRGAELVKQILTFSRKVETDRRPVNLNQEVRTAAELLSRTIPKMIDMRLNLSDRLCRISADPGQIEQIILNLALNAKDAMPFGGILTFETGTITLDEDYCRIHPEAKPGEHVCLKIHDTGHGMTREVMERIFEPFYSTKKQGEGTGLGLAMVYGIVVNHGGHITCYSETGVGTTFNIYFPTIEDDVVHRQIEVPEPSGGSETILLVDDEEMIRSLGCKLLEQAGYTVIVVQNGEEALEVYGSRGQGIDLVVLDVIMPGMGGHKALEYLKRMDSEVRVVIASGYSPDGLAKKLTESGASGFVGKPYHRTNLLSTVREVLDR